MKNLAILTVFFLIALILIVLSTQVTTIAMTITCLIGGLMVAFIAVVIFCDKNLR